MAKADEAKEILRMLGMPKGQQNDNAAYTLLAFTGLGPKMPWSKAQAVRTNPHGVIEFASKKFNKVYKENTRESIRRQAIHQFVQGASLFEILTILAWRQTARELTTPYRLKPWRQSGHLGRQSSNQR